MVKHIFVALYGRCRWFKLIDCRDRSGVKVKKRVKYCLSHKAIKAVTFFEVTQGLYWVLCLSSTGHNRPYNLGVVLTGGVYCIFPPKFLGTVQAWMAVTAPRGSDVLQSSWCRGRTWARRFQCSMPGGTLCSQQVSLWILDPLLQKNLDVFPPPENVFEVYQLTRVLIRNLKPNVLYAAVGLYYNHLHTNNNLHTKFNVERVFFDRKK